MSGHLHVIGGDGERERIKKEKRWSEVGHVPRGGLPGLIREPSYPLYIWSQYEGSGTTSTYRDDMRDPFGSKFSFSPVRSLTKRVHGRLRRI
jgi:hypothetical protein